MAAIALTFRARRPLLAVTAGIAVAPAATLGYLAATGAVTAAVIDVVLFPARHYNDIQVVAFGASTTPQQMPAAVFFPVTFVLAGATAVVGGGAMWRDVFPRPDVTHINFTLPLACPLFALLATRLLARLGRGLRVAVSMALLTVCALAIGTRLLGEALPMLSGPLREVPTTRGSFVTPPSTWLQAVAALVPHIERAHRGEAYFFYPYSPMLP